LYFSSVLQRNISLTLIGNGPNRTIPKGAEMKMLFASRLVTTPKENSSIPQVAHRDLQAILFAVQSHIDCKYTREWSIDLKCLGMV
jgi:hypothetical protein